MTSTLNRSLLAVAGLALVAVAATAAYWLDRQQPVDAITQEAFDADVMADTLDLQQQLTLDIDSRQLADEKARADSEDGLKLLGLCNAWIEFNENHPGEESLENRERACGNYRRFLESGELPASVPEPEQASN